MHEYDVLLDARTSCGAWCTTSLPCCSQGAPLQAQALLKRVLQIGVGAGSLTSLAVLLLQVRQDVKASAMRQRPACDLSSVLVCMPVLLCIWDSECTCCQMAPAFHASPSFQPLRMCSISSALQSLCLGSLLSGPF